MRSRFFLIAVFFLCVKTYVLYKFGFRIQSENPLQEVLLLMNPISSAVLLIGLSLFFSGKVRNIMVVVLSTVGTCILYFNLLYFRFFNDFLTWPVLFQTSNAQDIQGSIVELVRWADLILLIDILVLLYILFKKAVPLHLRSNREVVAMLAITALLFSLNVSVAQLERPQLLTRAFDREMLVKNIGIMNYHVYDIYVQSHSKAQRVFAESSDIDEVIRYRNENYKEPDADMFGIAEGKNVILISMESIQSFVLNETIDGEEITPFLNQLKEDSYYFDEFYHQTAQGKTSDSEFLVANSLFGRESGSVFFTHAGNEYNSLPEIVNEQGYYSTVMHANNKSFWNRDMMYLQFGYDKFFDIASYTVNEENSIGWGLKDVDFFEQSIDLLKSQPEPYYTKLITLTNHFPFELGEEDKMINEFDSNSGTLNRYFPTVRYMDYALEQFFERAKEEGIYDESIFILYGDHYGISEYHHRAMSLFLGKEKLTPFDHVQLQKVPMLIHIPGHEPKVSHSISGQIDVKPTIMHLLGIDTREDIQFGTDLFSKERPSFAVLRDGSFITDEFVYTKGSCYEKASEQETQLEKCEPFFEKAKLDLGLSDKVIYGDLMRFYQ
ncbi:hypothetical protein LQ50_01885 [Halalkalibacter okhensis]|uniref:Sulfatase N-terminal domain-containing protein n=2 Tax=Halalkalibacter okhensis TaxID=333138 RepID=A0A0B0IL70_9BACI|nr:hypothetical protein LQ50_01885 [Halalkalibacter okhensis]